MLRILARCLDKTKKFLDKRKNTPLEKDSFIFSYGSSDGNSSDDGIGMIIILLLLLLFLIFKNLFIK
jgi:hypothetical protein